MTSAKHRTLVGSVQEILTEGFSKRPAAVPAAEGSGKQWMGRTPGNKIVHFCDAGPRASADPIRPGRVVPVRIERALAHSLWGCLDPPRASGLP